MKRISLALFVLVALAGAVSAQVAYIDNNNPATGTSNTFPWAQQAFTSLHVYNAAQLTAAGITGGATLTDVAIAPSSGTTGTYNAPTCRFTIGHLANSPPIAGAWESNLVTPTVVHDLTSGPYTFPWTLNTWTSLPGVAAAGFVWNGTTDIAIFYTTNTGVTGTFNAHRTSTNLRHSVAIFNATTQAPTSNTLAAMKVRLTFTPGPPTYQTNGPAASLDVNGLQSSGYSPAASTHCFGSPITVNLNGLVGNGWELLFTNSPLVPAGGGALVTGNGQIVNVNLADPTTGFLWGLAFPPFPTPLGAAAPLAIPLGMPPVAVLAAQMAILDGSHPDGFRVSQAFQINGVAPAGTIPGPASDDSSVTVNLGAPPLCSVASIPFFGVNYTQMHVLSNGRVQFSGATGNTNFTPAVAQALTEQPMVGAWCDMDPTGIPAGTITISTPASDQVQVDWNGVVYYGTAITNTYSINFNATTGAVTIQNINGLGVGGTANMFLGISNGSLGATDPGVAPFGLGGPNTMGNGTTDMIYNFGLQGPALGGGANNITFTPNGLGGYTWTGT